MVAEVYPKVADIVPVVGKLIPAICTPDAVPCDGMKIVGRRKHATTQLDGLCVLFRNFCHRDLASVLPSPQRYSCRLRYPAGVATYACNPLPPSGIPAAGVADL